jgi:hypothetical protein
MNVYRLPREGGQRRKKNICLVIQGPPSPSSRAGSSSRRASSRAAACTSRPSSWRSATSTTRRPRNSSSSRRSSSARTPTKQNKNDIHNIIKPAFGDLIKSIYNSVDQYLARFREFKIHEILLSGGCGSFKNLDAALQANLNTKTILGTDITRMSSKDGKLPEEDKHLYTSAVGALMRGE